MFVPPGSRPAVFTFIGNSMVIVSLPESLILIFACPFLLRVVWTLLTIPDLDEHGFFSRR